MKHYARIVGDEVIEVIELPAKVDVNDVFPPELGFEPVDKSVKAGMIRKKGGKFEMPKLDKPEKEKSDG